MTRRAPQAVDVQLRALAELDAAALRDRWQQLFGRPPPQFLSRDLLQRAVAYRLQERAYGGLKPSTLRHLRAAVAAAGCRSTPRPSRQTALRPGTRLLREWNGQTHAVEVSSQGFVWRGQQFRSLSAIAREITGARWSGPRFFGITGQAAE
jgi:hypothetical protein